jgi:nucleotidyltransferase/DNA polymerase involved in DNA repair
MSALEEITPRVEQYSIDEMFLDLTGIDSCEDFEHFGRRLKAHALNTVGLPIGVGIGQTKTWLNRPNGPARSGNSFAASWRSHRIIRNAP